MRVYTHRGRQWEDFSEAVLDHIENYTVPQYGDMPNDQASGFTEAEIAMNMKRYLNRVGSNARGRGEAMRDAYKLAHYACLLHALISGARDGDALGTGCGDCENSGAGGAL